MKQMIQLLVVIGLLAMSGHLVAKDGKRTEVPLIFSNDIGPGVDLATVQPAKDGSAGIVYYVLTGRETPTEDIAAWVQKNGINKQQDGYGNVWTFEPMQPELGWSRMVKAEREQGGPIVDAKVMAGLQLTNYLNYKATTQAVTLALPAPSQTNPSTAGAGQSAKDADSAKPGEMIEVPASCIKGSELDAAGQHEKAIELYQACIDGGALNAEALGRTYRNIGIAYRGLRQFKTSLRYFELSLKEKPSDPWSDYVNQGNSYSDLGDYEQAMRLYYKAESLNPNLGDIAYNRGIVYERMGDSSAAILQFLIAYDKGLRSKLLFDKLVQYDLVDRNGLKTKR